jgi:Phosphate-selective porin O and P
MQRFLLAGLLLALAVPSPRLSAQGGTPDSVSAKPAAPAARPAAKAWYEKLSIRGYAQFRYNRLLETNENLNCPQCDRSIGRNGGFFLRRGRIILSGAVHPRVSIYIQPDYASDAAGTQHYFQLRDAYFDLALDTAKVHRLRFGQSKVPYGFENMQSSSNRLPLDRNDALNSAVANERDFGLFYYWTPTVAQRRFDHLLNSGLKGSGNYGVFALGTYNGQTANRPEANNSSHVVARLTYPWQLPNGQIVETSVQAYRGQVVVPTVSTGVTRDDQYLDAREAVTLVWYAQPIGLVAEYNRGRGPQYDAATNSIVERPLSGGFVQAMYRWQHDGQVIQPFVRLHEYHGGKKVELDARHYEVHETEVGVEWLPFAAFELTVMYTTSDRLFEDFATEGNRQRGSFLRLQAQFNY